VPRGCRGGVLSLGYAAAYQLLSPDGTPTPAGRALAGQLAAAERGEGERVVLPVLLAASEEQAITDFSQGAWGPQKVYWGALGGCETSLGAGARITQGP
jgi:hypothetical protein